MGTRKKQIIKVVFDTNVIYTGSFYYLLKKEMDELIKNHSSLVDIEIIWYIPEIVMKERLFQMNKEGRQLLPHIEKFEKLIGHDLGINTHVMQQKITEAVNRQINTYPLQVIKIDSKKIDWESLIDNSVNRLPPFEDNKKEKGFRDALILECLKQVIASSPTTKSACRIVFVTNDLLLKEAAIKLPREKSKIDIFSTIAELESLINIVNSETTETLIQSLVSEASDIFLEIDKESTLFYTADIRKSLNEKFTNELSITREGSDVRENGTWSIRKPGFEKKIKQRIFWKSIIEVEFSEYKNLPIEKLENITIQPSLTIDNPLPVSYVIPSQNSLIPPYVYAPVIQSPIPSVLSSNTKYWMYPPPKREKICQGVTKFEVMWSVTLTTRKKLKTPRVEGITFIETVYS